MTVERCHRWAAGRWERRDRVNRVSSSIPPSLLPSFLFHFAHARIRYVNSALQRLFNGSRPTREWRKKKKKKVHSPITSGFVPVSGLEGGRASISFFSSLFFYFFHSTRLDSTRFREFVEEKLHEGGYIWLSGRYTGLPRLLSKLCATSFYELPL